MHEKVAAINVVHLYIPSKLLVIFYETLFSKIIYLKDLAVICLRHIYAEIFSALCEICVRILNPLPH